MKKFITLLLVICFTNSYATIWYVSQGGKGTKDGTSWGNAAADFPDLLQDPTVNPSQKWDTQGPVHPNPGDTIFVSYGTYSPIVLWHGETFDTTTNMYYQSHQNLIHIYGGFNGKETSLEDRTNWKYNESIIDGQDNYFCIWIEGVNQDSLHYTRGIVIDGFTLRKGRGQGAAIRVVQNNPILSNLTIKENYGSPIIYLENSGSPNGDRYNEYTLLINNIIADNHIYQNQISVLSDAIISNIFSHVEIMNNTITNNLCDPNCYSLIFGINSNTIITNSILYDNGSDIEYYDNSQNVVFYRNNIIEYSFYNLYWNLIGADLGWNSDDDPMFIDANNFDYRLQDFSPGYDKGNFNKYDTLILRSGLNYQNCHLLNYDINCNNRIKDETIDIGACEINENTDNISPNYPTCPSELKQEETSNINIDNIKIYDITGVPLKSFKTTDDINLSDLRSGVYIVMYYSKNALIKSDKILLTNKNQSL
ncbi:MAG: T9SS type A sorting domain-containing protein [Candidatus Aphodosoma sp.]